MADGKAYAFAFDDVGNFESLVNDGDPRSAAITLNPFTDGGGGSTTPPAAGTPPTTGTPPTGTPPTTGTKLISNWSGKCIDVPRSNFADGAPLEAWNCNGTNAQSWTFTGGTLKTQNNMCMEVAWGSTANGAVIQIARCTGNAAQQFVLSAAGDLVNPHAN